MNNQAEMQDWGGDDGFATMVGEGDIATEREGASNSFEGSYRKSIAHIFSLLQGLIGRSVWAQHPIETPPPASESEISSLLAVLTTLSPLVGGKRQVDTSNIKKHPGIQKVLNNHTRGSAYMRQYIKMPLEHVTLPCECTACSRGLISPLTMTLTAYCEISALPLQIPQPPQANGLPGHLHYMSLEEAMKMPFTAEHQPSLEVRRARSNNTTAHESVALVGRERGTFDASHANKTF